MVMFLLIFAGISQQLVHSFLPTQEQKQTLKQRIVVFLVFFSSILKALGIFLIRITELICMVYPLVFFSDGVEFASLL